MPNLRSRHDRRSARDPNGELARTHSGKYGCASLSTTAAPLRPEDVFMSAWASNRNVFALSWTPLRSIRARGAKLFSSAFPHSGGLNEIERSGPRARRARGTRCCQQTGRAPAFTIPTFPELKIFDVPSGSHLSAGDSVEVQQTISSRICRAAVENVGRRSCEAGVSGSSVQHDDQRLLQRPLRRAVAKRGALSKKSACKVGSNTT